MKRFGAWALLAFFCTDAQALTATKLDTSPHKVQFVTVDKDVKLEVLDWGGAGKPLIFLAGLGDTAHAFDSFAPKLTDKYHVYGITRRGRGASSKPDPAVSNYSADRLGDDVLAVIDALKLDRPILVGHSFGGEELSSIASRYPEKVAGLVYLDAAYAYAYYTPGNLTPVGTNLTIDVNDLRTKVDKLNPPAVAPQQASAIDEVLRTELPQLKIDLLATHKLLQQLAKLPATQPPPQTPQMEIGRAMMAGVKKYTDLKKVPVLAIFAVPHAIPPNETAAMHAELRAIYANDGAQVKRFEAGNPSARVILLPNADHYVFRSNEADVLREMSTFMDRLPH